MCLALAAAHAQALVLTVSPGPKTIYLQVGNGSYTGFYNSGGSPARNELARSTWSRVTVPATAARHGHRAAR